MRVVFRVDSSTQIGIGHVMRCLVLANSLKENNASVDFICRKHNGSLIDKICEQGFNVFELGSPKSIMSNTVMSSYSSWLGATQQDDAKECIDILQSEKVDLLIVDHYALDEYWHNQLNKYCNKLMVIDDIADRKFQCDILLNQNLGICESDYKNKVPSDCKLLLGCDYALLRPEFQELRKLALEKRKNTTKIKNILISVGGSDVDNITYDFIHKINNSLNIVVVLGSASPHNEMIKKYANNRKSRNIKVVIDANNMSELMLNADLAIGAGGSTSWERCCLGLPTLLLITAENQRKAAERLAIIGAVKIIQNLKDDLQSLLDDFSLWTSMSKKAQIVCDGLGVKRIKV